MAWQALKADIHSDSDFPTLSGGPRQAPASNAAAGWNSAAIRQTSQQQQQPQQPAPPQQQRAPSTAHSQHSLDQFDGQRSQQPSDRTGGGEDFPPLGGQVNGDALGAQSNGFNSSIASPDSTHLRPNGQQAQIPIREASNAAFSQPQQAPIGSGQPAPPAQQQLAQNGQPPAPSLGVKKYADMSENEKYGLTGLLAAFEARGQAESGGPIDSTLPPAMRNAVFLGQDLSSLGLDLDSPDPLYPTFTPFPAANGSGSQFDFHDRHMVPDFTLPSAYTVTNVPPLSSRMSAFSDGTIPHLPYPSGTVANVVLSETLFSIFYQHPRDILQELASIELTARDWRWHKVLRQWLQKDTRESSTGSSLPIVDLANGAPVGAQPVRVGERTERGVYVFFDAMNWRRERREFVLDYGELDHRHAGGVGGVGGGGGGQQQMSNGVPAAPGLTGGPVQAPVPSAPGLNTSVGGIGAVGGQGSSQIPSA